ncbi:unnamed protein product [Vicia faba]|uniref:Mediator of RNA polymerase II transcription subunit 6 n=1 Tax=Vicia faba TaxID=3906 RepID=A0AAV1B4E2_VICFA|nr:unnamed protein product [Vicia faba]
MSAPGVGMLDGGVPTAQPPGIDMTGICFRDQLWLNTYPLDRNLVFDYFALSPFYDWTCNNEQIRMRSLHPLDPSQLTKMTGNRRGIAPDKVTPMLSYYILDGSIYQSPQLSNVFAARIGRALYYIQKAFTTAASKLEKSGYVDTEKETTVSEPKAAKETIDLKEIKRVDHILASLQRKLPTTSAAAPLKPLHTTTTTTAQLPNHDHPPSTSDPHNNSTLTIALPLT